MDNFALPPKQPLPTSQPGPVLPPLPPKRQLSPEPGTENQTEEAAEAQLQEMLAEIPPIPAQPPQCDWHLSSLFSGSYPDPFSLPAAHLAKHSLIHDVAAFVGAVVQAGKEALAAEDASKDTTAK